MQVSSSLLDREIVRLDECGFERFQLGVKPVARYHDRATGWDCLRHLAKPLE